MNKRELIGFVAVTMLAASVAAYTVPASAQAQGYGPGMMGGYPGMMGGYGPGPDGGYGPGMMGPGYGYGMMGPGMMGRGWVVPQPDLNLSEADVKTFFERWLSAQGNPRLTLGDIKRSDADTIAVDVVTKDKKVLVQRYLVNRHTGYFRTDEG